MTRTFPILLLVVGLGLLAISMIVPWVVRPQMAWTPEKALEHKASAATLHRMKHMVGHARAEKSKRPAADAHAHEPSPAPPSAEQLATVQEQYERNAAELQAAIARPHWTAAIFRWLGVICLIAGGTAHFLLRH